MGVSNRITAQKYTQIKDYAKEQRGKGYSASAVTSMIQDKFKVGETTARLIRLTTNYQAYRLRTNKYRQPKQLVYHPKMKDLDARRAADNEGYMLGVILLAGGVVVGIVIIALIIVVIKILGGIEK